MNLKKIKTLLPYLVIGILVGYVVFLQECTRDDTVETTTVTETTSIDSTTVDSLTSRIEYLESVPPETVRVEIPVPEPIETEEVLPDGTVVKEYTTSYRDSTITASWSLLIAGELRNQEFEYIPKPIPVIRETVTKYVTQYRTTTREIESILRPKPYLSVGLEVGGGPDIFLASPEITWTTGKGNTYSFKYDIINEAYLVGFTVPIRFRNFSLF